MKLAIAKNMLFTSKTMEKLGRSIVSSMSMAIDLEKQKKSAVEPC